MSPINDRITLTREINRSQVAAVWEGYDTVLDRKVLVKAINPQFAYDHDIRTRFEREARAVARISHPNVVQIYDVEIQDERLRLILEFVEGATLGALLKKHKRLPTEIALSIACGIMLGLKHAHAEGIIHRDLKPDNILISHRGEVKITDFGMATLKDQPTVTLERNALGTPSYWAPEQAFGSALSERTDLFTAGLILFEMLTGRRVIEGESLLELYHNISNYRPPDLCLYADCIPEQVMPILRSLMERDSASRMESASLTFDVLSKTTVAGILPSTSISDYMAGKASFEELDAFSMTATDKKGSDAAARSAAFESVKPLPDLGTPEETDRKIAVKDLPAEELPAGEPEAVAEVSATLTIRAPGRRQRVGLWIAGIVVLVAVAALWLWFPVSEPPITQTIPEDTTKGVGTEQPIVNDTTTTRPEHPRDTTKTDSVPISKPPIKPKEKPTAAVSEGAIGTLRIQCRPWARVYISDSLWGTTPMSDPLQLTSGAHTVVLINDEIKQPVSRIVTILPDSTVLLDIDLYDYVAKIRAASVRPWADVYVDGTKEFRTPSSRTIFLPLGTHTITLQHPDFKPYSEEVVFRQGDPVYEIRVDLLQM
jgi:serine/threonine protein kinase